MTKIIISMLLLLNLNLFASIVDDGVAAYLQGDVKLANKLYLKACQKGSTKGCLKSGLLYYAGSNMVKQNIVKAKKTICKSMQTK